MKVAILAGGLGTRLAEQTESKPKPMVEVGGHPILWHIMKGFGAHGVREFVVALGYKGQLVKDYFVNYRHRYQSLTVDMASGKVDVHGAPVEDWRVHLVDTGEATMTGGRLGRLKDSLRDGTFLMTYGDGVANVDIRALLEFHRRHGKKATVTAVRPPARFGGIVTEGDRVVTFTEKPQIGEGWINGGFFVLEPSVLDYVTDDTTVWERQPMEQLAEEGELMVYRHEGFWQCMDTVRDLKLLESLWAGGAAPWKVW